LIEKYIFVSTKQTKHFMLLKTPEISLMLTKFFRLFSFTLILIFTFSNSVFSQYYWVGGTGNWSDYTNHWVTTSGGNTFHTEAPTSDDDVFFDANSISETGQTITLDLAQNKCKSMDWTGVQFFPSVECAFFDDLFIYGSVIFAADVTYNLSEVRMNSTGTGNTITSNGSFLGSSSSIRKYGTGECGLVDNLHCDGLNIIEGTFFTNDHDILLEFSFRLDGSLTKTIHLGSSEIHCQQWRTTGANNTINAGTSTIFTSSMYPDEDESGPYTYNNLTFENGALIYGSGIFNTIDANAIAGDNFRFKGGTIVTFNSFLLDADRHNPVDLFLGQGTGFVTLVQNTGTVTISYAILSDIHASGGATFNVNPGIDNGNNDGWNFTAISPLNFYWIGNEGNWSDLNHWATTSGGAVNPTELPSQFDDVYFDENSVTISAQTITVDEAVYFRNMDWTGILNNPTFFAGYTNVLNVFGDFTLTETLNKNLYSVNFQGDQSEVFFWKFRVGKLPLFLGWWYLYYSI
jgi:hypothetical protein